ncbi:MAG: hypothetical protein ACKODC_08865 [Limnohabitans sp.]
MLEPFAKNGTNGFLHQLLDARLQERQHMHALAKQIMARLQPGIEQLVQETVRTVLREGLQHPSSGPSD